MKDLICEIGITEKQLEKFINSSQEVILGNIGRELIYDPDFRDFIPIPNFDHSSIESTPVYIYKGEASDNPQNTYIIENIQSERPKAYYVYSDGIKKEVKVRLIGKDIAEPKDEWNLEEVMGKVAIDPFGATTSGELQVTAVTSFGDGPLFISKLIDAEYVTEAIVIKNDLDEFNNSSETIAYGDILCEDWTRSHVTKDFELTAVTLRMLSIAVPTLDYSVVFYKGKDNNYQPDTFVVEDIQTGSPKVFYVDLEGVKREIKNVRFVELSTNELCETVPKDIVVWASVWDYELEHFINSSEMVIRGSSRGSRVPFYDKTTDAFVNGYCYNLYTRPSADFSKNNVLFFKEQANDCPPNTIVVECVQTQHLKAFYIEDDGVKKELEFKIESLERPLVADDFKEPYQWDSFDEIHLFRNQMEEIKNSPQSVVLGHTTLGSVSEGVIGVVLELNPAIFGCYGRYCNTNVYLH